MTEMGNDREALSAGRVPCNLQAMPIAQGMWTGTGTSAG